MARTHGRIKVSIWDSGSDFRELSRDAQWAYILLISQPGMTMCGTLPYTPKRWARFARGLSMERVEEAIRELEQGWYVVVDRESDELLVRTMVKHDQAWRLPNLVIRARRQFSEIESQVIRDYLADRHKWLVNGAMDASAIERYEEEKALEQASERPLPMGMRMDM